MSLRVHCPGTCQEEDVKCQRTPPADVDDRCRAWATRGRCGKHEQRRSTRSLPSAPPSALPSLHVHPNRCEHEWGRGNGYFLSQCFESCGRHNASMLLEAMLADIGNTNLQFPSSLVDLASVGEPATVHVDADGRVVGERGADIAC